MSTLVSVIIPCHNSAETLAEAIESALAQTHKPIEIVIVDDGSTDHSDMVAKQYKDKVTYLRQPNQGAGSARNAGVRACHGEFITFLDADDRIAPDFVSLSLKTVRSNGGYSYTAMQRFGQRGDLAETHSFDPVRLAVVGNYIGIGVLIKRTDFLQAGGFDESLDAYEDWDFWLKLLEHGHRGTLIDQPLYFWRWHGPSRNQLAPEHLQKLSRTIKKRHWQLFARYWPGFFVRKLANIGATNPVNLTPASIKIPLSVVIPSWNARTMIGDCLNSLAQQSLKNIEIIVVENGSTDGSAEFIEKNYPDVLLLQQPVNLGFAAGVNVGIKAARGQTIALLNNDAVVDPEWAQQLVNGLQKADIVQAKILQFAKRDIIDSTGDTLTKWGLPYPSGRDTKDTGQTGEVEIFSACGGAVAFRRSVFETVGLFDEDFFAYIEDFDLSFRARLVGCKILLVPSALVYHRVGGTASKLTVSGEIRAQKEGASPISQFQRFYYIRNSNYLFYKDFPPVLLLRTLPRFFIAQLLLFLSAALNGGLLVALKAYGQLIWHFPRLLIKRRRVMSSRVISTAEISAWMTDFWPFRFTIIGRLKKKLRLL